MPESQRPRRGKMDYTKVITQVTTVLNGLGKLLQYLIPNFQVCKAGKKYLLGESLEIYSNTSMFQLSRWDLTKHWLNINNKKTQVIKF